ncbi:MAG: amino acid permease, partial [Gemmatimonadales bacterium]
MADQPAARPSDRRVAPSALPAPDPGAVPETLRYRLKNALLGPPLATERQATERLGKPTALAVLSSDVISSSAYATEELLVPLVPVIGVAAYSLVVPVTLAVLAVLVVVTLSYLEVVKVYTKAGGAYVVARENFGLNIAQIAAVALLIDYTLTVAVSVAAGVAALTSVFPGLFRRNAGDRRRARRPDRLRQPARRARVGTDLRGPDLLLHRQHGDPARCRRVQGDVRRPRPRGLH